MSNSKHTPGPWKVNNDFQEEGTYANCFVVHTTPPLPGLHCARARGDSFEHPPEVREVMDANCRLIAAAPELDAYRQYIEDNLERIERGGWTPVCFDEFRESEECANYMTEEEA